MELTHAALTEIAVKWLKRPHGKKGPGCKLAISECRSGLDGEAPDAIGWRATGYSDGFDGSTVVEVKVSRSDFLADAKKPHRNGTTRALGNWRYYMCPTGLIKPDELPSKWGLLYVNSRSHVKPVVGAVMHERYDRRTDALTATRQESDLERERFILTKLFARIGDPEAVNREVRAAMNRANYLAKLVDGERERHSYQVSLHLRECAIVDEIRKHHPELVERIEAQFPKPTIRSRLRRPQ